MNFDKFFNVLTFIVAVALVTTIVAHPTSAKVIQALGESFTGAINAAIGTDLQRAR